MKLTGSDAFLMQAGAALKPAGFVLLIFACFVDPAHSQGSDVVRRRIRIDHVDWEYAAGLNITAPMISDIPEGKPVSDFKSGFSPGFQFGIFPVYRVSRHLGIRSGLIFLRRKASYEQLVPWNAEYSERSSSLGIPLQARYSLGYSDVKLLLQAGWHFHCQFLNQLDYSALAIPGYRQHGTVNISFDRKRLLADFQAGLGLRFQISRIYLGTEVLYFVGLSRHSRFDPPRTIQFYREGEPPLPFYSPVYRSHGIMLNLVIQKRQP